ncbi:unnamed protein product, partial [Medioppia subpectinata]
MESQMDIRVQSTLGNKKLKTLRMSNKPMNVFRAKALIAKVPIDSPEFARLMDEDDPFRRFRHQFVFPLKKDLPYG